MSEFITLFLISVGLSMDAFAVSITNGLCYTGLTKKQVLLIPFTFGVFQGLMTLTGFFLGSTVSALISSVDHWIAFVILVFIGGKMLFEAFEENKEEKITIKVFTVKELMIQGFATSVDALAVGLSFAALAIEIWSSSFLIAAVTYAICFFGVLIGKKFGGYLKKKAVIAGGLILIIIGIKILIEHIA